MRFFLLFVLLLNTLVFGEPKFLMPEEAFKASAYMKKKCTVSATIELGESIYLYKSKIKATIVEKNSGVIIDHITLPEGVNHEGETVFTTSPIIDIKLAKDRPIETIVPITLQLSYQGCSEQGLCYEPIDTRFTFNIETAKLVFKGKAVTPVTASPSAKKSPITVSETDRITQTFIEGNVPLILLTFFTFGLLLSLTPCIFPMIPILSSIIVAQGKHMSAMRGFMLSLVYVLSMSVAYTIAGVLAGLFGGNIQIAMQNPWVISTFALLFVGLAVSMFGFFKIGLPSSWQTRLTKTSNEASSKGGYIGVAIMGFLSALIVGPCVAPPLAGALVYIGQSGNALLGGSALFVLSLGMGVPLLLIGTGAGKYMPRPGGWMDRVSHVFGVVMLAIAIWMLSRILPPAVSMLLLSALLIVVSIYLGALEPLGEHYKGFKAFLKGIGVILLAYGLILLYGGIKGSGDPLAPLTFANETQPTSVSGQNADMEFKIIHSSEELDTLLAQSKGKKVMLDFYADWCTSCKELDHTTFKDPRVIESLKEYVLIRADVTANSDAEQALAKRFNLFGPPAMIFFDESGKSIQGADLIGFKDAETFIAHIKTLEKP
ncbi:Protein-disulfide reductase (plasmid) [Sulfuricurvum kujiense DSM 16994]|uniref:Protein-disulfide reductase n=1 Tax=Sulfuricurvum kujiense (strain ATCC BAA-921 / DSM 16994 / JCM 11577 / YK-1) TaxID=709032 RepID=E4U3X0_SULKY|nr:protein-disulfide reductase DsbD [Sulfuricurvum kujiense]ADR35386.1 Protein-disulfide reductase [Sulfuricurvum kujiense DSM 16994]